VQKRAPAIDPGIASIDCFAENGADPQICNFGAHSVCLWVRGQACQHLYARLSPQNARFIVAPGCFIVADYQDLSVLSVYFHPCDIYARC
jgi:hypothetical protein